MMSWKRVSQVSQMSQKSTESLKMILNGHLWAFMHLKCTFRTLRWIYSWLTPFESRWVNVSRGESMWVGTYTTTHHQRREIQYSNQYSIDKTRYQKKIFILYSISLLRFPTLSRILAREIEEAYSAVWANSFLFLDVSLKSVRDLTES